MIYPNPLILSKIESSIIKGHVILKNPSDKLMLFTLSFDPELFCGISPACGEIEPNQSIQLILQFDNIHSSIEELSFIVHYTLVRPNIDQATKTELMFNSIDWNGNEKSIIRFSSHAEDALSSFSQLIKQRPSFSQAVMRSTSRNFEQGQKDSLVKTLLEKELQQNKLKEKINNLRNQINIFDHQYSTMGSPSNRSQILIFIGFIMFILSLIIRKFK